MSDLNAARRQAEEALSYYSMEPYSVAEPASIAIAAIDALLAATTPLALAETRWTLCPDYDPEHPQHGDCPRCGGFGALCIAATTPVALPLPDGVREAAEELRAYLPVWINGGLGEDGQLRYRIEDLLAALTALDAAPSADAAPSLEALAIEADNFARTTFPSRSAESISEHLRREAVELAAAPNDAEEMADVFILLGNLVHFTGTDLNAAVVAKLAKNRARKWGKPDAHGVVEHVRDAPPADAAAEDDTECYHCGASHWCSECAKD